MPITHQFATLAKWSHVLDAAFRIPGTRIRFGWDALVGLVPGLGDLATPLLSALIILEGFRQGLSRLVLARMLLNVVIDVVVGAVPVVGDLFDVAWKANLRNLALLNARREQAGRASVGDWLFVGLILMTLAALAVLARLESVRNGRKGIMLQIEPPRCGCQWRDRAR